MKWNQPKAILKNIFFYLGLLSLLISSLGYYYLYILHNEPKLINQIDRKIPTNFSENISEIYKKAKASKSPEEKAYHFNVLNTALGNITSLNKFYSYRSEALSFLIKNKLSNKHYDDAYNLSKYWFNNYPYDFNAKFSYFDVLKVVDKKTSIIFIEEMFKKYNDIKEVGMLYLNFLMENKDFAKSVNLALFLKNKFPKKHNFQLYFIENGANKFTPKSTIRIADSLSEYKDNLYKVQFSRKFKNLKALRFDINNSDIGDKITEISFVLKTSKGIFKDIKIIKVNHITSINDSHIIKKHDPFFKLDLPSELKGYSGKITFKFSLKIMSIIDITIDKFLKNKEWKVNYSNKQFFSKDNSKKLKVMLLNEDLQIYAKTANFKHNMFRLDFPSIKNMSYKISNLVDSKKLKLNYQIINYHNIENNQDGSFTVIKDDPYLIFKLKEPKDIKSISANLKIGLKE